MMVAMVHMLLPHLEEDTATGNNLSTTELGTVLPAASTASITSRTAGTAHELMQTCIRCIISYISYVHTHVHMVHMLATVHMYMLAGSLECTVHGLTSMELCCSH